ncbi:MAG: hypothetical protein Tsb002_26620 [Wenzhouxiangellaceae bacterium]
MHSYSPWRLNLWRVGVAAMLAITLCAPAQSSDTTGESYRHLLYQLIDTVISVRQISGLADSSGDLQRALQHVDSLSDEQLQQLADGLPAAAEIENRLRQLRLELDAIQAMPTVGTKTDDVRAADGPGVRTIDFPEPEVEIAECANTSASSALALLGIKFLLEEILAGVKWACHETVAGFNSAAACVTPEVLANVAKAGFEFAEFCLKEKGSANSEAMRQTVRNIGEHLNEFVDTKVSTRSTQVSVNAIDTAVATANTALTDIQTDLDEQFPLISANFGDVIDDLTSLSLRLNGLVAQAQDLQQRVQISQVEIQDIDLRTADIQQRAEEIRDDTQSLLLQMTTTRQQLASHDLAVGQGLTRARRERIAEILSDPDRRIVLYLVPSQLGGELEEVREVLIRAIAAIQAIGGKTTTAVSLLAQGDQAFNGQQYPEAYDFYAQAYRSLAPVSNVIRGGEK